jgi:hypothetical protein
MHGDPDKGPGMLVMPRRHGFNRFRSVSWVALSVERNLLAVPQDVQLRRLPSRDVNENIAAARFRRDEAKIITVENFTVPMAFLWPFGNCYQW